jgi:cytochrome c oxidase subunit 4
MSSDHAHAPYYKVLAGLTVLTVAEIVWALPAVGMARIPLLVGLGVMAAVKAAMVGLYYMHLKYEGRILWTVILFPIGLVGIMILGLVWDAVHYW